VAEKQFCCGGISMLERQYTRIDVVRKYVDEMLNCLSDLEQRRNGFVHLYGVGQACALIALRRGHDRNYAELSEIAGMLHDYSKYRSGREENHARESSADARNLLAETGRFSKREIDEICDAIYVHSDKGEVHSEFDEILKDADAMQHWLRNPAEDYFFNRDRVQKLLKEFELSAL